MGCILGKWCQKNMDIALCKYCGNGGIENEINFFLSVEFTMHHVETYFLNKNY